MKCYIGVNGFPLPLALTCLHSQGKRGPKICKQGDILLHPMNWKKQQLIELEDHCTFPADILIDNIDGTDQ